MLFLAWTWITFIVILLTFLLQSRLRKNKHKKLPPSPSGIPILGHLHLLGKNPHHDLYKLSQKHGPIIHLRLGFVPLIVVSSPHTAEQILKTNDLIFASRPRLEAGKYVAYNFKSISFSKYDSFWRGMRKLITLELLSAHRIKSFQAMRKGELNILVEFIKKADHERVAVNLSAKVASMNADMSCLMIFGKKYKDEDIDEKGFKSVVKEAMQLGGIPNLGDYFPFLGKVDLQGLTKRMKAVSKVFDKFFERIIDEHVECPKEQGQTTDFVDTLLAIMKSDGADVRIEREHIKAIMLDMLAASMDTSASTVEWLMSALIKNPRVMKKVQRELEEVVGMERKVEESDLEKLEYLNMAIKESFRLHPVGPLLLPHEAIKDCTVDGYHVPEKSRVMVNIYAIGRDPKVWTDPEKFLPERFAGSNVDLRGHDFQLIPFGSGRRGCPGLQLGLTVVRLVVAQLVHCFDWELPNGISHEELDMTEEFGVVVTRANHLMAIPKYRLSE